MKLTAERLWWLKKFDGMGWTIADPMRCGIKKWRAHTAMLVKAGLLEADGFTEVSGSPMCRITEAGRTALTETKL